MIKPGDLVVNAQTYDRRILDDLPVYVYLISDPSAGYSGENTLIMQNSIPCLLIATWSSRMASDGDWVQILMSDSLKLGWVHVSQLMKVNP